MELSTVHSAEEARALLRSDLLHRWAIAPDGDADGLAAGMIAARALERMGHEVSTIFPGKGEHVHAPAMRQRIRAWCPEALLVLDMGSRGAPIGAECPTVVVDHHLPVRGLPPDALVVSGVGLDPVPSSALLTWELFRPLVDVRDLDWLAALGTVGDLGRSPPFPQVRAALSRHGSKAVADAVALLNAPRRAGSHDVRSAWEVLSRAGSPGEIARAAVPGVDRLQAYREEVAAEVARCAKTRPRLAGEVAVLPIRSAAKVHPLVATRWTGRLDDRIVVAANFGYLEGKVNFAMRTARDVDLLAFLHGLGVPLPGDAGFGHARATGGSLPLLDFAQVLNAMGFDWIAIEQMFKETLG